MKASRLPQRSSLAEQRLALAGRLKHRRPELEQMALARVQALFGSSTATDAEYVDGLRSAVEAAIDYAVRSLEGGEAEPPDVPRALLWQARLAARYGVSIDTVMRRYFAGYLLLADFLFQAAEEVEADRATMMRLMREQMLPFNRLIDAVTAEYGREETLSKETVELRRLSRLKRLLNGEILDADEFDYNLHGDHRGVIVVGSNPVKVLRRLAAGLGSQLLVASPGEETAWGWLGGERACAREAIDKALSRLSLSGRAMVFGGPARGLSGWRLTHRQAKAALPIARRRAAPVHYQEVALLAAALNDDLLSTSLRDAYLRPLEQERDGGLAARETLRAYFSAERNASSAAALLGVSRRTVTNRLRGIEERLQRTLRAVGTELEVALQLEELPGPEG